MQNEWATVLCRKIKKMHERNLKVKVGDNHILFCETPSKRHSPRFPKKSEIRGYFQQFHIDLLRKRHHIHYGKLLRSWQLGKISFYHRHLVDNLDFINIIS